MSGWENVLPGAANLICMIETLRRGGNLDLAAQLENLADQQAQVLRRQKAIVSNIDDNVNAAEEEIINQNELIKERSISSFSRRNSDSDYSWVSESQWQSDWEEYCDSDNSEEEVRYIPTPPPLPPPDPFRAFDARLRTFRRSRFKWTSPSESELAETGFVFIGPSRDKLRCFSCNIVIATRFAPAEDPWVRHAVVSPNCIYLVSQRGPEFVANCRKSALSAATPRKRRKPATSSTISDTLSHMHKRVSRNSKTYQQRRFFQ